MSFRNWRYGEAPPPRLPSYDPDLNAELAALACLPDTRRASEVDELHDAKPERAPPTDEQKARGNRRLKIALGTLARAAMRPAGR